MEQVNIIIGRFQPITNGHIRCAEQAKAKTGCKSILLMIDTPEHKVDERHPFPSSMLLPIYKDLFKHSSTIQDILLVKNADIVKAAELCKQSGYEIHSWSCGTDRIDAYQKMADKYSEQANLPADFRMIEIRRGDGDESATALRAALLKDDKETFFEMFPKIEISTDIYKELREQILTVYNK